MKARLLVEVNQISRLDHEGLAEIPVDAVEGRELLSNGRRIVDFCNTNYLGFDFESKPQEIGFEYTREFGSLFGLSRLEATPRIYQALEAEVAQFVGAKDCILSHTVTITNFSLMSAIAKKGLILADEKVHTVVFEAARLARDHGATLERFSHQNTAGLRDLLEKHSSISPKIVCVDGVYSVSGAKAPLAEMHALCEEFDAWLFVDDAHGFGILGRNPAAAHPYGRDGAGVVQFAGSIAGKDLQSRTFYVSSFGKAFCTHTAFVVPPLAYPEPLREQCLQYIFSAPVTPYVLGLARGALLLNAQVGEERRQQILKLTKRFVEGLRNLDCCVQNDSYFPIVFWEVGSLDRLIAAAKHLLAAGVLGGLRAYPVVPRDKCGIRFGITALHTENQIDRSLGAIADFRNKTRG